MLRTMEEKKTAAAIALALKEAPPSSVEAATAFSFSALLTWPEGVSREGATYRVQEGERSMQGGALPEPSEDDGSVGFTLRAPDEVGEHRLTLIVKGAGHE